MSVTAKTKQDILPIALNINLGYGVGKNEGNMVDLDFVCYICILVYNNNDMQLVKEWHDNEFDILSIQKSR